MVTSPLRVLALTKYGPLAASSRTRFYQYASLLANRNIFVEFAPLLSDAYISRRHADVRTNYLNVTQSFISRLATLRHVSRYDVLWIEGELFPRLPAVIERLLPQLGRRFVIDLDDAIFHTYDLHRNATVRALLGHKIDVIFRSATSVVVGNEYLADRARRSGAAHVVVVPTSVDHCAYAATDPLPHAKLTFGWIGSPATGIYLRTIAPEIEELCNSSRARLHLIGIENHDFALAEVITSRWNQESEIETLAACDIGLAPLSDGPWERGKCGLKAIQYMASGIPVLAANVGALPTIVQHGKTGFIYRDGAEFAQYARQLAGDPELRGRMGTAGRERVAASYSIHGWVDTIADVLTDAASKRGTKPPILRPG